MLQGKIDCCNAATISHSSDYAWNLKAKAGALK
jgi:hypothetical protein